MSEQHEGHHTQDAGRDADVVEVQPGHEHATPRGSVITLGANWVAERTPEQLRAYITAVTALVGVPGRTEGQIAAELKERLDAADLALPELSYTRAAEILRNASSVEIMTDDGHLLYSQHAASAEEIVNREPHLLAGEDPEDDERPIWV